VTGNTTAATPRWNNGAGDAYALSPNLVRNYNFSPQTPPQLRIALPSAFNTLSDILQLPLQTVTVESEIRVLAQENGSLVRTWNTARVFFQDTWRLNSRLNLNYGLAGASTRTSTNDLTKPALLAPILGADGLGKPTRRQWKNFSPVLGLAWCRGGTERPCFAQAPACSTISCSAPSSTPSAHCSAHRVRPTEYLRNHDLQCRGVPPGTALRFPASTPTLFTGEDLLSCLPAIQPS